MTKNCLKLVCGLRNEVSRTMDNLEIGPFTTWQEVSDGIILRFNYNTQVFFLSNFFFVFFVNKAMNGWLLTLNKTLYFPFI